MVTLVLDELLTVAGHSRQTCQLSQTRPSVRHVTRVRTCWITTFHQSSGFTVVTDDCHTHTGLVSHVTKHIEWSLASYTVRVDDVISVCQKGMSAFQVTA